MNFFFLYFFFIYLVFIIKVTKHLRLAIDSNILQLKNCSEGILSNQQKFVISFSNQSLVYLHLIANNPLSNSLFSPQFCLYPRDPFTLLLTVIRPSREIMARVGYIEDKRLI